MDDPSFAKNGRLHIVAGLTAALALHGGLWTLLSLNHAGPQYWYLAYLPAMALLAFLFGWQSGGLLLALVATGKLFNWPWPQTHSITLPPLILLGTLLLAYVQWTHSDHARLQLLGSEWRQLLGGMGEAVFIFDAHGRVVHASPAAQRLSRNSYVRLRGQTIEQLVTGECREQRAAKGGVQSRAAAHARPLERNCIREALETNRPVKVECNLPARSTGQRQLNLNGTALPLRISGKPMGVVLVVSDCTEQTLLESRMAEAERHLAIGQMAAGITHDFNNILEVIEKSTAILALHVGEAEGEQQKYLRAIHLGVVRGSETLRRLREYLAGSSLSGPELLDLADMAHDALELTRPLWREQDRIRLHSDLLPTTPVSGNPVDLRRLLTNLLLNALEALKVSGGEISIRTRADGQRVQCIVRDNGPGIPLEDQPYIFRPYFTTKAEGSGLGLAEAHKIALSHQGQLSFTSQPGRGTEFVLDLPANPAAMAQSA